MALNLGAARGAAAQSGSWILVQQPFDDVAGVRRDSGREAHLKSSPVSTRSFLASELRGPPHLHGQNVPSDREAVPVVERGDADDHLVEERAEAPPVNCAPVLRPAEDFRGHIVLRAAPRGRRGAIRHLPLAHAKVRHLDVAVRAQQQVLELEVPVDDVQAVQVRDGTRDLGRVELGPLLGERVLVLEVEVEVAAAHVLGDQEEAVAGGKRAFQVL